VRYAQGLPAQRTRTRGRAAPPAKLPVRIHEVQIVGGDIIVIESSEVPNLPPGLTHPKPYI
jgi:3-phenylpropionate/trans-cinnamate dioxygenase ferredoxin subunit